MITKLRLAIDPSEIGFKRFLKEQIGLARFRISHIEQNDSKIFINFLEWPT